MRKFFAASALIALSLPVAAYALEGSGPRVTITGTVTEVRITEKQAFDQEGAEIIVKASNGQYVTLVITKDTEIVSEGKLSRKLLIPANVQVGMNVRVRGWRLGTDSMTASLFIILNLEVNPAFSANGIIQAIDGANVTVLSQDGKSRTYTLTNESEVNISYTMHGASGVSFVGKQALLTLNSTDATQIRILRITGEPPVQRTIKPTTVELKKR